jgi:hypothetical protein
MTNTIASQTNTIESQTNTIESQANTIESQASTIEDKTSTINQMTTTIENMSNSVLVIFNTVAITPDGVLSTSAIASRAPSIETLVLAGNYQPSGLNLSAFTSLRKLFMSGGTMNDTVRTSVANIAASAPLDTLYIPTWGASTLAANTFKGCNNLRTLSGFTDITQIGANAFENCSRLATIPFLNLTSIGASAFSGCSALTNISLSSSITSIPANAFKGCAELAMAINSQNITSLGISAFEGCAKVTSVSMPSVTSVPEKAFKGCARLTAASFPNAANIGNNAFSSCNGGLTWGEPNRLLGVQTFETSAFASCGLLTLSMLDTVKIPTNAFEETTLIPTVIDTQLKFKEAWDEIVTGAPKAVQNPTFRVTGGSILLFDRVNQALKMNPEDFADIGGLRGKIVNAQQLSILEINCLSNKFSTKNSKKDSDNEFMTLEIVSGSDVVATISEHGFFSCIKFNGTASNPWMNYVNDRTQHGWRNCMKRYLTNDDWKMFEKTKDPVRSMSVNLSGVTYKIYTKQETPSSSETRVIYIGSYPSDSAWKNPDTMSNVEFLALFDGTMTDAIRSAIVGKAYCDSKSPAADMGLWRTNLKQLICPEWGPILQSSDGEGAFSNLDNDSCSMEILQGFNNVIEIRGTNCGAFYNNKALKYIPEFPNVITCPPSFVSNCANIKVVIGLPRLTSPLGGSMAFGGHGAFYKCPCLTRVSGFNCVLELTGAVLEQSNALTEVSGFESITAFGTGSILPSQLVTLPFIGKGGSNPSINVTYRDATRDKARVVNFTYKTKTTNTTPNFFYVPIDSSTKFNIKLISSFMTANYSKADILSFINVILNCTMSDFGSSTSNTNGDLFLESWDVGPYISASDLTGHDGMIRRIWLNGAILSWNGSSWTP